MWKLLHRDSLMSDTDFHETKETHSHFLPGEFPDISLFIFWDNTASESGSCCFYLMLIYAVSMLSYIVVGFGFWILGFSR